MLRLIAKESRLIPSSLRQVTAIGPQRYSTKPEKKAVPYESSLHDSKDDKQTTSLPSEADVVVIGGGSVGCSTAYHLAKMGAGKVVLLEKHKLTAGTTWHTAGLLWRMNGHDAELEIIEHTRKLMTEVLPQETGLETGWVQTGGLFTAYTKERMDAYKYMATISKAFGVESQLLNKNEINDVHPLVDTSNLIGAYYSPLDGSMDPAGTCVTYTRAAAKYGAQIIEDCSVIDIATKEDTMGVKRIDSVTTNLGIIKTKNIVNCTGVWAPYIGQMVGVPVPQVAYKHAYIVTESIEGVKNTPNMRDHDASVYFKRQGDTIQIGGYEANPIPIEVMEKDFAFGLYDLNWDVFGRHLELACAAIPAVAETGVRSTVCGPESFTPDRNPLIGESPLVRGFFYGSGFNSGGMMLGGGAGKQIAHWVMEGRPDIDMFSWDIRRFPSSLFENKTWLNERSHESYAKHYSIAFHHDQPLAGRNLRKDALHQALLDRGCFFEEKHGWERPSYFPASETPPRVLDYDFYGSYEHKKHEDYLYNDFVVKDYTFDYPGEVHKQIGKECLTCRTHAAMFNQTYMGKLFLKGPDAGKAARHIFSRDVEGGKKSNPCTYTLMLNQKGGIEADLVVAKVKDGNGETEYYLTVGGYAAEYCKGHISDHLNSLGLDCTVEDRTEQMAILSLQGPSSRDILQKVIGNNNLSKLKFSRWTEEKIAGLPALIMRLSFVGETGYEIHCSMEDAKAIYDVIMNEDNAICDAGYRALESLSTEIGFHHWGHSIRSDDTPLEAHLMHLCDKEAGYVGSESVGRMRGTKPQKTLACFTVDDKVQLLGHEVIYKDGNIVGYIRNAVHAFAMDKGIAFGYLNSSDSSAIQGEYHIEVKGVKHRANVHCGSPFDPKFNRLFGKYSSEDQTKYKDMINNL